MPRDILSEFGRDADKPMASRAAHGGIMPVRDVIGYASPMGPTTFGHEGPGLAGRTNFGNCGTQGKHSLNADGSGYPGDLNTDRTKVEGSQRG